MGYAKSKGNGPTNERRSLTRTVRFAPQELQLVAQRARAAGQPLTRYIRESSLGPSPRPRRAHLSNKLINMLGLIALQLTQIATEAKHQHLAKAHEFDEAVSKAIDIIRELE